MNSVRVFGWSNMAVFLLVYFSPAAHAQWISQPVPPDVSLLLSVDVSSEGHAVACGYVSGFTGRAIHTTNGGTTWSLAQVPDSSRSLVSVQLFESGLGYIAGAYNSSLPIGTSQLAHASFSRGDPVASARADYSLRIGMNGADNYRGLFLRSTNNGESWSTWGVLPESTYYLLGVSFVSPDTGWVTASTTLDVGEAEILRTVDGGLTWTAAGISDSIVSLPSIQFFNSMVGFAVGYQSNSHIISGVILRTTNGGTSWEQHDFPQVDNFTGVSVSDAITAYASGESAAIYKTTNAGIDWAPLPFSPSSELLEGVCVANGTTTGEVFGVTTFPDIGPYAARTTDGGSSWRPATLPSVPEGTILTGGILLDENIGYLVGGSLGAVVFHTTNGGSIEHFPLDIGNLWQLRDADLNLSIESEVVGDTTFPNGETYTIVGGYGAGISGTYVRQEGSRVLSYGIYDSIETAIYDFDAEVGDTIDFLQGSPIILEDKGSVEFYGRTLTQWTFGICCLEWVTLIDSIGLYRVATEPGVLIYDFQGAIVNGVQYGIITDIINIPAVPAIIQLSQNYPNPFNPSTTISFSLPRSGDMSLKIFNLLGEEVATLVSGYREAGTQTVQWDANGQPSGVYFYRLSVMPTARPASQAKRGERDLVPHEGDGRAENFTETRKLVIVR